MGRLTTVLEPDPNTNVPTAETGYTYDALSNLLQVDQLGASSGANTSTCLSPTGTATSGSACDRQRAFSYDGLSRLKYSTNPESGTIAYNYDNNSNVHTKTDARGITTTDSYDGLNRLTGKTYTDGTSSVSYHYDSPVQGWNFLDQTSPSWTGVQQNNLIERLSYENDSSSTIVYGYDAVGRPNLKSECTPSTCGSDHYDMHASYDLAGDIAFADRGLDAARNAQSPNDGYYYGGLTFSYNNAGQIASATSDIVDAAHPQLILGALNHTPWEGCIQWSWVRSMHRCPSMTRAGV